MTCDAAEHSGSVRTLVHFTCINEDSSIESEDSSLENDDFGRLISINPTMFV